VVAIAVVGLILRLVYLLLVGRHTNGIGDFFFYHLSADRIGAGDGFKDPFLDRLGVPYPTALHPPAWPGLLGAVAFFGGTSVLTQRIVGCVVGALVIVVLGYLGRQVAGERVGYVTAVLAALTPDLIGADASLMAETLYGLFVALALLLAVRAGRRLTPKVALLLGIVLGLAALTRGEGLFLVPLLALPLAVTTLTRQRLACTALVLAGVAVVVLPWTARNWTTFGQPVLISTNDSTVLAGANCASTYARPQIGYWDLNCIAARNLKLNEAQQADVWRKQGSEYAKAHRGRLITVVAPVRILRTWDLWEPWKQVGFAEGRDRHLQQVGTVVFFVEALAAIAGLVFLRRRRLSTAILLAPVLVVTVTSAIGFGMPRFRHAGELAVIVLAAVAVDRLLGRRFVPSSTEQDTGGRTPVAVPAGTAH
jgi:4-amino-4-deoxy-L-arabinose transferase-like glycosyltransferase